MADRVTTRKYGAGSTVGHVVTFTVPKLERLRKALEENRAATVFEFEGDEYAVSYARYLVEYLSREFKLGGPTKISGKAKGGSV